MRWINVFLLSLFTYLGLANGYLRTAYSDTKFLCEQFGLCQTIFSQNPLLDNPALSSIVALATGLGILYFLSQSVPQSVINLLRVGIAPYAIVFTLFIILLIIPSYHQTILRQKEGLHRHAHDGGVIQIEEAISFFESGKNPYTENYYGTPMEQWGDPKAWEKLGYDEGNPALHHLPYLPASFLVHIPFQSVGKWIFGFYDARMLHWFAILGSAIIATFLTKSTIPKQTALIAILLNPLNSDFIIYGMNDWLVLFWLVATLVALYKRNFVLMAFVYGIACATKTFAWFWLPFIIVFVIRHHTPLINLTAIRTLLLQKHLRYSVAVFVLTVMVFIGPFLMWNPRTFISDVVTFNTGTAEISYPIRGDGGFGFGTFVLLFGLVDSPRDYFPFGVFQLLFGLPILLTFLYKMWKSPSLANLLVGNVAFFSIFVYFSRFWHRNYFLYVLVYLILLFIMKYQSDKTKYNAITENQHYKQ